MVATAKTLIYHLRNTMSTSSLLIVIICICLPAIFGMPYLGPSNNFDKIYRTSLLDEPESAGDFDEVLTDYQRRKHPFQDLGDILDEVYDDESETGFDVGTFDNFDNQDDKVVGARAKRLGFSYFPFRYTRQFLLKQQNRALPDLLRAANSYKQEEYPPVKRRLAFTALRGR